MCASLKCGVGHICCATSQSWCSKISHPTGQLARGLTTLQCFLYQNQILAGAIMC
jgi:hypothetical protein